ncbi:hypothetical protein BHE74_00047695 [Ensete ventricosum]|nr:hypothetical protein BHE74_00047695 [Ensete ventricosum]RZS11019.1 hypothetical protein BHM03_00042297 [Ensete ventricosum]
MEAAAREEGEERAIGSDGREAGEAASRRKRQQWRREQLAGWLQVAEGWRRDRGGSDIDIWRLVVVHCRGLAGGSGREERKKARREEGKNVRTVRPGNDKGARLDVREEGKEGVAGQKQRKKGDGMATTGEKGR